MPTDSAVSDPPANARADALARLGVALGRATLASLFVLGGIAKLASPELYLALMGEAGLPAARPLLLAVAALELGGGLWLASGLPGHAPAALVLAAHTLAINVLVHPFWTLRGPERIDEISFFFKNLAIVGALVFVAAVALVRRRERAGRRDGAA